MCAHPYTVTHQPPLSLHFHTAAHTLLTIAPIIVMIRCVIRFQELDFKAVCDLLKKEVATCACVLRQPHLPLSNSTPPSTSGNDTQR